MRIELLRAVTKQEHTLEAHPGGTAGDRASEGGPRKALTGPSMAP